MYTNQFRILEYVPSKNLLHKLSCLAIQKRMLRCSLQVKVIPSTAAVFRSSAHCLIMSTVLIIAFQILPGSSFKKSTTPLNAIFIFSTRLFIISLNPSQLSYKSLKAPANGFTNNSNSPCQFPFTNSITLLNAFGIVFVKKPAIALTAVPIAFFIPSHTLTSLCPCVFVRCDKTNYRRYKCSYQRYY